MTPEELTTVVTAHQLAISRHDQEMAEMRSILNQIAQSQVQTEAQQQINTQAIAGLTQQQQLNQEALASLIAGIAELRNQVSDYIQGRSQIEQ